MSTPRAGIATAYDLTTEVIVNIDEAIYMTSPQDSPMLTGMGADGLSLIGSQGVDQISFEWMHDEILVPRSTLSGAHSTADAFITVASGDQINFSTGDILRIVKAAGASEYVRVTGYGTSTDTLLVTRGFDGTTATTHPTGAKVIGLGTALAEGSDPENARSLDRDKFSNNTQIFGPTAVHMSATEQVIRKYGVPDEFSRQSFHRTVENGLQRENAFLYGRKYNSTTSKVRTTGGVLQFVTSNVSTATQLTVLTVQAAQQLAYNRGGMWDRLMANPSSLGDLNEPTDTTRVRTDIVDSRRGRVRVSIVTTEFGDVTIARNRWLDPMDALGFGRENVKRRILRPLVLQRLAKTGDSDKVQIVCEEGLQVKGELHMAKFGSLAYT